MRKLVTEEKKMKKMQSKPENFYECIISHLSNYWTEFDMKGHITIGFEM